MANADNGKGSSKVPLPSAKQDAIRRAKKGHKPRTTVTIVQQRKPHEARLSAPAIKIVSREQFIDRIGNVLANLAGTYDWSQDVRDQVVDLVHALVYGGNVAPDGLHGFPLRLVRQRFAMTCLVMRVPPGTLPGQSSDWYHQFYLDAMCYLSSKKQLASASR